MKFFRLIILLFCFTLLACLKKDEGTNSKKFFFDPKIPGGVIGIKSPILPVDELSADVSEDSKIILTWKIPSIYLPLQYQIKIYKHRGSDPNWKLPNPEQMYNSADLYKVAEIQSDTWTDSNPVDGSALNVDYDTDYQYWVYIFLNNRWSEVSTIRVHTPSASSVFTLPSADKFWTNLTWRMGQNPKSDGSHDVFTMGAGNPSVGNPKGSTAFALDGSIMYFADTDNNRIVIYAREMALACQMYKSDPELYGVCLYQASGSPFTQRNVLGQPDQTSTDSCGNHSICSNKTNEFACTTGIGCVWNADSNECSFPLDRCLTRPTKITVSGGKLLVSDSGNDRVMVWNSLPVNGCDPEIVSGQIVPANDCTASLQIGKKSLFDANTYSLNIDGDKILKNPTGLAVDGNNLYISDTGHHRVVKIKDYSEEQIFSCNENNWNSTLCKFSSVLGQPSFFVSRTFNDIVLENKQKDQACQLWTSMTLNNKNLCVQNSDCEWLEGQIVGGGGICQIKNPIIDRENLGHVLGASYSNTLKHYFANPTTIKITPEGKLLVLSNENYTANSKIETPIKLNSRILVFDSNTFSKDSSDCNSASFESGGCDASSVLGQLDFKTLVLLQGADHKYSDTAYGLESLIDFDIMGKNMIGVDSSPNAYVYLWNDWLATSLSGSKQNQKALNPMGAPMGDNPQNYPYLRGLGAVSILPSLRTIYVTDSLGYRVFEVRSYSLVD